MISVVLVPISAFTGVLTIGGAMAVEESNKTEYVWATMILLICTIGLSFIAGALS
jgi:hypothetical protein